MGNRPNPIKATRQHANVVTSRYTVTCTTNSWNRKCGNENRIYKNYSLCFTHSTYFFLVYSGCFPFPFLCRFFIAIFTRFNIFRISCTLVPHCFCFQLFGLEWSLAQGLNSAATLKTNLYDTIFVSVNHRLSSSYTCPELVHRLYGHSVYSRGLSASQKHIAILSI